MFRFTPVIAAIVLVGCADPQKPDAPSGTTLGGFTEITFANRTATADERKACEATGGEARPAGKAQFDMCVQTYPDAGKTCSDASDCLGRCVLEVGIDATPERGTLVTGVCEADTDQFGCTPLVNGGVFEGAICID